MKVLLVTRHFISNFGSFLQTYASVKAINRCGYECDVLDFFERKERSIFSSKIWARNYKKNFILEIGYFLVCSLPNCFTEYRYHIMRKKYLPLTVRFSNKNQLIQLENYDIYISGSDQLWGRICDSPINSVYFLDFIGDNKFCFSYASSFGDINYSYEKKYAELLKKYHCISVREKTAKIFLNKLNINSEIVVDPTLLFDKEFYENFIGKRIINKKYILVYQLHNSSAIEIAKRISKERNFEIIRISSNLSHRFKNMSSFFYTSNPFKFLNLIKNAEYVVTDSFHATVFSIIFHKEFITKSPGKTSSRISDLLNEYNLIDRYITKNNYKLPSDNVDWLQIDELVNISREKSWDFLKKSLGEVKHGK